MSPWPRGHTTRALAFDAQGRAAGEGQGIGYRVYGLGFRVLMFTGPVLIYSVLVLTTSFKFMHLYTSARHVIHIVYTG